MIVRCSCCGTRYRYRGPAGESAAAATCSRCESPVELVAARPEYLLVAEEKAWPQPAVAAVVPAGGGIGMDDPTLAARLVRTAMDAGPEQASQAMTYRVTADKEEEPAADHEIRREALPAGVAPPVRERAAPRATREVDLPAEDGEGRSAKTPGGLVLGLLTVIGLVAGYYMSVDQGLSAATGMGAGGGLGLLFGWIVHRWTRGKD